MNDTIITSEAPSASTQFDRPSHTICRVCEKQFSQYTCPRCNIRYCSLPCYKSHSLRCTESFMRENVVEELQQLQPDDESKQKMLDILKRFHEEDEIDSMDEDSFLSEETIQKIMSGNQVSLDDLSPEEKKRFQRAIASGELSKLIKPWDPWWLKASAKHISLGEDGTSLIQPLVDQDSEHEVESKQLHDIPPGPSIPLPSVTKLSTAAPSPLLAIHLIDIIYSYCFTLRLYNGDWQSDALESAMVLLGVSSVLGKNVQPETLVEALSNCLEQTSSPAYRHMGGLKFGFSLLDDVISVLYLGASGIVCLLCDTQRMIEAALKEVKLEKVKKLKKVEIKNNFKSAERKVYFMMCWVHEQPAEVWSSLAAVVSREKSLAVECTGRKTAVATREAMKRAGKPLIKEIQ